MASQQSLPEPEISLLPLVGMQSSNENKTPGSQLFGGNRGKVEVTVTASQTFLIDDDPADKLRLRAMQGVAFKGLTLKSIEVTRVQQDGRDMEMEANLITPDYEGMPLTMQYSDARDIHMKCQLEGRVVPVRTVIPRASRQSGDSQPRPADRLATAFKGIKPGTATWAGARWEEQQAGEEEPIQPESNAQSRRARKGAMWNARRHLSGLPMQAGVDGIGIARTLEVNEVQNLLYTGIYPRNPADKRWIGLEDGATDEMKIDSITKELAEKEI